MSNQHTDAVRLAAILETAVDAIICIDSKGIIDSFNIAAEKMFGYKAKEVLGENISILMPEPYSSEHDNYIKHHEETGEEHIIGIGREVVGKRKGGLIFSN
jgi:two-component system sensor kinase FixL